MDYSDFQASCHIIIIIIIIIIVTHMTIARQRIGEHISGDTLSTIGGYPLLGANTHLPAETESW
jgi:hypothetical protein